MTKALSTFGAWRQIRPDLPLDASNFVTLNHKLSILDPAANLWWLHFVMVLHRGRAMCPRG
eukprot:CAMPEP_0174324986 /NCGR_PEP_ID=MMETSP0810-20121108/12909_1 /TAXON_ID=73025 ORGANISM="Eutreptiella gymnastica-like, Strain CCMP1594" /NCGR_SAMPLE_ID=MMETSP0810 /ASSEMBLY_ACC=CAM_ASM_000659 /LENGTH=60 /DNA_ID=CAMNT_0015438069 /DNA_START=235 /DNA_END=414 /DNA_ORIENTATION=-